MQKFAQALEYIVDIPLITFLIFNTIRFVIWREGKVILIAMKFRKWYLLRIIYTFYIMSACRLRTEVCLNLESMSMYLQKLHAKRKIFRIAFRMNV